VSVPQGRGAFVPRPTLSRDTLLGLASTQRRTLAFALTAVNVTGAAGAYSETIVGLNNAFSVYGGASAIGYAKYMAFYSKCFVVGSQVRFRGTVGGVTATIPAQVGLTVSTNNTSFVSAATAVDNGMVDYMVVGLNPDRVEIRQSVDVKRFLNKPNILDDPQLYSTAAAGPAQVIDAHLWIATTAGAAGVATLAGIVEIELDCVFTDPIPFT